MTILHVYKVYVFINLGKKNKFSRPSRIRFCVCIHIIICRIQKSFILCQALHIVTYRMFPILTFLSNCKAHRYYAESYIQYSA